MANKEPKTPPAVARIIADREQNKPVAAVQTEAGQSAALFPGDEASHAKRPPVARVNFGGVQASIWANPSDQGEFHTVTFARRFLEGGEWKTSNSYNAHDALALAKVADLAVNKIIELQHGRGRAA